MRMNARACILLPSLPFRGHKLIASLFKPPRLDFKDSPLLNSKDVDSFPITREKVCVKGHPLMTDSRSFSLRHDEPLDFSKVAGLSSYDPRLDHARQFEWYGTFAGVTRKV